MSNAFLYRMPSGIPGAISRQSPCTIEPGFFDSGATFGGYGLAGKIVSGKFDPIAGGDVASSVYGILVRPYPTTGANASDPLGTSVPPTTGMCNILRRGYISVKCNNGTPALNGPVYVRIANPSGAKVVGGFEAAADVTAAGVAGANTGNGTIGTLSATQAAVPGAYKVTFSAATVFAVTDPNGLQLKVGATGVAYTAEGVTFTITAGGTAFVAGDTFTVTVTDNTIQLSNAIWMGAADGSPGNAEIAYNI